MMPIHLPLTLAFDWSDLIGIAVVLVVTFGSAIGTWLKRQAEAREAMRRRERSLMSSHTLDEDETVGRGQAHASLSDAASQRREQLRAMARQRAQMPGGGAAPRSAAQPRNLTMAERIARARAQEEYAKRAQALEAQADQARRQAQQQFERQQVAQERQAARERLQREAQARQQAELRRRAAARQQQQRQQRQQQQRAAARQRASQSQRSAAQVRQVSPPPTPASPAAARPVPQQRQRTGASSQSSRRQRAAAPAARAQASSIAVPNLRDVRSLTRQSLRDAFVLKEILDRPVALRQPGADGLL